MPATENKSAPLKKSITFISRAAPYGSNNPHLCLDMALACAVFEQDVNYVFLNDGVYQLLRNQKGASIESKTIGNALETLELYGIDSVCVDEESLSQRGLRVEDLVIDVKLLSRQAIATLLHRSDCVFNL